MIQPFRARYGNRDKRHDLLEWNGAPAVVPSALAGLTDRPPNATGPDAHWWPSVGCGPIDGLWALWWTEPDFSAARGGMVLSEVAIWRLDDIGNVEDLRPVMQSLRGDKPLPESSPEIFAAVIDALLSRNTLPPVLLDLELWPGVIVALWTRLWPEARRVFSARVAFAPPQGGDSVLPPWLYGAPAKQALSWSQHRQIATTVPGIQLDRAGRWLAGADDSTFYEVFRACPFRPSTLDKLTTIARGADRLDQLRALKSFETGRDFLRTFVTLAPHAHDAQQLKREALDVLLGQFTDASWNLVTSLRNVDVAALPNDHALDSAVEAWSARHLATLPIDNSKRILEYLLPGQSNDWWKHSVERALTSEVDKPTTSWTRAALQWLGTRSVVPALERLLPTTSAMEQCFMDVFPQIDFGRANLETLRQQATTRHWSRLHALVVLGLFQPNEAFYSQWAFPENPLAGMAVLIERIPGLVVVDEAITLDASAVFPLAAKRTAREPALLQSLDAAIPAWRALWAAHIAAGGTPWPPGVNRSTAARSLLDAAIAGGDVDKLVGTLAEGLATEAFDHPNRAELWTRLGRMARETLLNNVANALISRCNNAYDIPRPEDELRNAVVTMVRATQPSARVIVMLLRWNIGISEDELIGWLGGPRASEWAAVAAELGNAVKQRHWSRAAKAIYDRAWSTKELRVAAATCGELLSGLDSLLVKLWGGSSVDAVAYESALAERVADLGATLATDRLELLWERAGGERKRLRDWGAPDARWRYATSLAQSGALHGGLAALVSHLRAEFPHNIDLQRVATMLSTRR